MAKSQNGGRFTLGQTIAWIAWKDPDRPTGTSKPPEFVSSGTRRPPEVAHYYHESWQREFEVSVAGGKLERAIKAGELDSISGRLVTRGSPHEGVLDWLEHDPIPPETTNWKCEIPLVWISRHGGWLLFKEGGKNGRDCGPRYCNVTFAEEQVRRLSDASRAISEVPESQEILKTGAQGRPSSMQLIMLEFQRRAAASECEVSAGLEAKALSIWIKKSHPTAPPATAKTIKNNLIKAKLSYRIKRPKIIDTKE